MTLSRSKANAGSPQDTDAAQTPLIEAFHAGRGSVDGLVALGARCLADGDAQTAVAFARAARFLSPGRAGPDLLLGRALVERGEYSPAVDVLRGALAAQGLAQPGAAGVGGTTAGRAEASGVAAHDAQTSHAEVGDAATDDASVGDVAAGDIEADAAQTSECDARIALGRALSKSARTAEAIPEFERAVALSPESAVALTWLGEALAQAKRYPEAFTALNRAVAVDPTYGRAHTALGEALIEVGRPAAALAPLKQALALDTGRGAPAVAFAQALVRLGKLAESLPWFNRAIEIEPTCAEAFRHLGRTLAALRLDSEALNCIRAARQLRGGDWPDTWMDEAGLLLRRGDYRAGWRAYENREFAQRLATITPSVWDGDDSVAGESLLLIAEQGLGDTIQFFRFARHVAALGAQVTVEVQPPLKALLARSVAGIDHVQVIARGDPQPAFTRQNSLVSMPHALRAEGESYGSDVPYLHARDDRIPTWRAKLDARWLSGVDSGPDVDKNAGMDARGATNGTNGGIGAASTAPEGLAAPTHPRLRIGLVASGNPLFRSDADRSMPLAEAAPLFSRPDIQWVVVQPELRGRDQPTLDAHPAVWLCGGELRDFDDTAALLATLDLVISVDSSVAHLAGAMGRPVWLLLPFFGDWRWLQDRSDSPWYPSATLFRQAGPQDWKSVIAAVSNALDAWPTA
jgi:tetratricopeptide (TPR) repeat protein